MMIIRWLVFLLALCLATAVRAQDSLSVVRYEFDTPPGPEWGYIQSPDSTRYQLHDGKLRLYGSVTALHENLQPTFLALRPDTAQFTMTTLVSLYDFGNGDEAGLAVYQSPGGYVQCCLNRDRDDYRVKLRLHLRSLHFLMENRSVGAVTQFFLQIRTSATSYKFYYSLDGKRYHYLNALDRSLLRPVVAGGGSGILAGLYAYQGSNKMQAGRSYADFDYLEYVQLIKTE